MVWLHSLCWRFWLCGRAALADLSCYPVPPQPSCHHHVTLADLKTSTTYYYVAGDATGGFSEVNSFTTAAGEDVKSFKVAMFGDMGYGENGHAIATRNQLDRVYSEYDWVYLVGVSAAPSVGT